MFEAAPSPFLVPFDGRFRIPASPTAPPESGSSGKSARKALKDRIDELDDLQRMLAAQDRYSVLLVFQAMDAAGKDGTIRAVMSGINPAGGHLADLVDLDLVGAFLASWCIHVQPSFC